MKNRRFSKHKLCATLKNKEIALTFSAQDKKEFLSLCAKARVLEGSYFDKKNKEWKADLSVFNLRALKQWGFKISKKLRLWLQNNREERPQSTKGLYLYQYKGVSLLERFKGRALLADEMGLGKTIQALAYINNHTDMDCVIIICPSSVKAHWAREAARWLHRDYNIYFLQSNPTRCPLEYCLVHKSLTQDQANIYVLNYDIISNWAPLLQRKQPKLVICDEARYIKNNKTIRAKNTKKICNKAKKVILIDGTPIESKPIELHNLISVVNKKIFPSSYRYKMRYCDAKHNGFGWNYDGASNIKELHEILTSTCMIRRKKAEVLKYLPKKQRIVVPLSIDNRPEYNEALEDIRSFLQNTEHNNANALVKIEILKQIACRGKLTQAESWIRDYLVHFSKLVVFCTHHTTVDAMHAAFPNNSIVITGKSNKQERAEAENIFNNNDKINLIIGTVKAAGSGYTFTAAKDTVTLELEWNPSLHDQAEDRVHRIGQKSSNVSAYYLLAENTIEEKIAKMHDKKRKILSNVLDGSNLKKDFNMMHLLKQSLTKEKGYEKS